MLATHQDAEQRYSKLRAVALQTAQRTINNAGKAVKITTIDNAALNASKRWHQSSTRKVDWDWFDGYNAFRFRYPKRFEVALWQTSKLIGLSMGRPTYHGTALRLDVVEGSPPDLGERPAVFDMIQVAYGIYARMINASEIRIMNPINDQVRAYYERYGYQYVPKKDYLYREVQ